MSTLPEELPEIPDQNAPDQSGASNAAEQHGLATGHDFSRAETDAKSIGALASDEASPSVNNDGHQSLEPGHGFNHAETAADAIGALDPTSEPRIPHFGHLLLLLPLGFLGLVCAGLLGTIGIHYHLFGVSGMDDATTEIHYMLGSEAILYLVTLASSLLVFPFLWHKSLFTGLSWHAATARRLSPFLLGAAFVCFVLAIVNGWLLPGPSDAPIDKMIRQPGAAWMLFAFGVTFAPFFEELVFRGFLLSSLCTACDWIAEKLAHRSRRPLSPDGAPQWSLPAMIIASIITSVPFAAMHAAQTGNSIGPFLLLIVVSMVLCGTRLYTRSLAASVTVHACYNFMLFSLMLIGTGGFKHLENM